MKFLIFLLLIFVTIQLCLTQEQNSKKKVLINGTTVEEKKIDLSTYFNDEMWPDMWYLHRGGVGSHGLDMNVYEAWAEGYSGKGVVVTMMDDGIEWNHPDLSDNYDKNASTDLNDNDDDPFPKNNEENHYENYQGTNTAGIVSAVANNSICGVGIAFKSKIGGIRVLDGQINDELEGKALRFNRNYIDIYTAGWGPDDDGSTVDGPGPLARAALREGIDHGRNGKGSIFVWASGVGGFFHDDCNCDGYTTSIYTLSISSTSEKGTVPWFAEYCSSTIASTFSASEKMVTTAINGGCADKFGGTSASSAIATGIVALTLEANPGLTWRDVQHIVIRTANSEGILKTDDWSTNSAGRKFSHFFGFGLMDAGKMVKLAKKWKNVPGHFNCTSDQSILPGNNSTISAESEESYYLDASSCSEIKYIEHIQLHIDLNSVAMRGDLSVHLESPAGTVSTLLGNRLYDYERTGFQLFEKWPMMSVHYWGESVSPKLNVSEWRLTIINSGDLPAYLNSWRITFYGTKEDPQP